MTTQYGILRRIRQLSETLSTVSNSYDQLLARERKHVAVDAMLSSMCEIAAQLKQEVSLLREFRPISASSQNPAHSARPLGGPGSPTDEEDRS